jgi:hypothetical protein
MNRMRLWAGLTTGTAVATRPVCAYIKAMYGWTIIMVLH